MFNKILMEGAACEMAWVMGTAAVEEEQIVFADGFLICV